MCFKGLKVFVKKPIYMNEIPVIYVCLNYYNKQFNHFIFLLDMLIYALVEFSVSSFFQKMIL